MGQQPSTLGVATISHVVQSGRAELLALRNRLLRSRARAVDRETWETAQEACAIDESDREIYERLFTLYDKRGTGNVNMKEFLVGLATIVNGNLEERLQIAMELWDDASAGFLATHDVLAVLVSMNKTCGFFGDKPMDYDQLDVLVRSTFETYAPRLVDQKLSYRDHVGDLAIHPIMEIFLNKQYEVDDVH